eukprot:scaffold81982_cov31-Tisochrysis_lutea.AAC.5
MCRLIGASRRSTTQNCSRESGSPHEHVTRADAGRLNKPSTLPPRASCCSNPRSPASDGMSA